MATAGDWITAALNRSAQNDAGKLAQTDELLLHADRVYQRLWALLARQRPDEMCATASITLASAPAAASLPAGTIDVLRVTDADGADVTVAPAHEADRLWHLAPCVVRRGPTLVTRGKAGDPVASDVLSLLVLDSPTALTATSTAIDSRFPTRHHQLAIDSIALYLSTKESGRSKEDRQALTDELKLAGAAFASEYGLEPSAIAWLHAPVERKGAAA